MHPTPRPAQLSVPEGWKFFMAIPCFYATNWSMGPHARVSLNKFKNVES